MWWLALAATITIPLGLDLYMPVPKSNPFTYEKIELGRQLFHDRRLSRDHSLSCTSCHRPQHAFADDKSVAVGVFGRQGKRNVPAIINRGYGRAFFWDGHVPTLEEQVIQPIQNANEMDLTLAEASARVGLAPEEIASALATYVRSILSGSSPFDRYANGDREALTAQQQQGLQIFREKGNCATCHMGPNLTDERVHNTGVAWQEGQLSDMGAGRGDFKTPTLREVARTAPYMHDGSFATLEDVIDFYSNGGRKNANLDPEIRSLKFSNEEKSALLAFLQALSGQITEGNW